MGDYGYIRDNYLSLLGELDALGDKVGRRIQLVAVTKSGSDEELMALAECGVPAIGENRPQELRRRGDLLAVAGYTPELHEIGNLQKNKVRQIIEHVALIHSVDSTDLAEEINKRAELCGRRVPVLIEVNSAEEPNKGGVMPALTEELFLAIRQLPWIEVHGLMTMGPAVEDPEMIRPYLRLTKELFDDLKNKYGLPNGGILSMGMSDSYRVAIEEGATMVRVGSRLFSKTKGE